MDIKIGTSILSTQGYFGKIAEVTFMARKVPSIGMRGTLGQKLYYLKLAKEPLDQGFSPFTKYGVIIESTGAFIYRINESELLEVIKAYDFTLTEPKEKDNKMDNIKVGTILLDESLGKLAEVTYLGTIQIKDGGKETEGYYELKLSEAARMLSTFKGVRHEINGTFAYNVKESVLNYYINLHKLKISNPIPIKEKQERALNKIQNQIDNLSELSKALNTACQESLSGTINLYTNNLQKALRELQDLKEN